jgi:hypothetical protein
MNRTIKSQIHDGAALALVVCAALAHAAHPLSTEDIGTQGHGALELEASLLAASASAGFELLRLGGGLAVQVGLGERVDLGATVDIAGLQDSGMTLEDPRLTLKWRLVDATALPGLAVRVGWLLPGAGAAQVVGTLERGAWELHGNVGSTVGFAHRDISWSASLACAVRVGPTLRLGAEVLGHWHPHPPGEAAGAAIFAALWQLAAGATVSAGAGPMFSDSASPSWQATLGFTLAVG